MCYLVTRETRLSFGDFFFGDDSETWTTLLLFSLFGGISPLVSASAVLLCLHIRSAYKLTFRILFFSHFLSLVLPFFFFSEPSIFLLSCVRVCLYAHQFSFFFSSVFVFNGELKQQIKLFIARDRKSVV